MAAAQMFKKLKTPFYAFSVATCLILSSAASSGNRDENGVTLSLGLYTSNKPSTMVRKFRPIVKHLEVKMAEKLGHPVNIRMQLAKNYEQGIAHLTTGKVDFSRFGPAPYIEAKKSNPDIKILAMESINKSKVFHGIIATHVDNPIENIGQLRGQSFGFGDQQSTIGRFLSQQYLADSGVGAKDLSHFEYLGRHDIVGTKVGSGEFVAGALNESTFRKLLSKGEQIRELARFPNVTKPWIARSGLDEKVFEALQLCLLELTDKESLQRLKIDGFLKGEDLDYEVIRTAIDGNERFFTMKKYSEPAGAAVVTEVPAASEATAGQEIKEQIADIAESE